MIELNVTNDSSLRSVGQVLRSIESELQGAEGAAYRYNNSSIRIRVLWDGFTEMDRLQRDELIWPYFKNRVTDNVRQQITMLLLLAPEEKSLLSVEFEQPSKSLL